MIKVNIDSDKSCSHYILQMWWKWCFISEAFPQETHNPNLIMKTIPASSHLRDIPPKPWLLKTIKVIKDK